MKSGLVCPSAARIAQCRVWYSLVLLKEHPGSKHRSLQEAENRSTSRSSSPLLQLGHLSCDTQICRSGSENLNISNRQNQCCPVKAESGREPVEPVGQIASKVLIRDVPAKWAIVATLLWHMGFILWFHMIYII